MLSVLKKPFLLVLGFIALLQTSCSFNPTLEEFWEEKAAWRAQVKSNMDKALTTAAKGEYEIKNCDLTGLIGIEYFGRANVGYCASSYLDPSNEDLFHLDNVTDLDYVTMPVLLDVYGSFEEFAGDPLFNPPGSKMPDYQLEEYELFEKLEYIMISRQVELDSTSYAHTLHHHMIDRQSGEIICTYETSFIGEKEIFQDSDGIRELHMEQLHLQCPVIQ